MWLVVTGEKSEKADVQAYDLYNGWFCSMRVNNTQKDSTYLNKDMISCIKWKIVGC